LKSQPDYHIIRLCHPDPQLLTRLDRFHRALIRGSSTPPEQFMDFVTKRLDDEKMLLILGLVGDTPAGYGLAFDVVEHAFMPEWQRAGYITQFFVAPEYRRQSLGQTMLEFIIQWLASRGVTEVLLNVSPDNRGGEQFWKNQGFVPHRTRMKREI